MPFRLNNTEITAMKFNNVDVEKAYLNGTQVFTSGPAIGELYEGGYYIGDNKVCTNRALKRIEGTYDICVSTISGTINGYSDWYLPSIAELEVLYSLKGTFTTLGIWDYLSEYHWSSDNTDTSSFSKAFNLGYGNVKSPLKGSSCQAVAFRSIV